MCGSVLIIFHVKSCLTEGLHKPVSSDFDERINPFASSLIFSAFQ